TPGDKLADVLTELEGSKDAAFTVALKAAIPQLVEPAKKKAREALTDRLMLQDAAVLKELFQDDDAETRRAAALAYARKPGRTTIPDLIDLLDDPEPIVVQAAREALKEMTAQDYGPMPNASRTQRSLSRAAWYGWWLKQAPRSEPKK